MLLPKLQEFAVQKDMTEIFSGYNNNLRIGAGDWFDMKNMTTDYYPIASPREPRAIQKHINATDIAYVDNHLISLHQNGDEVEVRKDGETIGHYTASESEGSRCLVRNGSRIVIMPDGIVIENDSITSIDVNIQFENETLTFTEGEEQGFPIANDERGCLRYFTVIKDDNDALGWKVLNEGHNGSTRTYQNRYNAYDNGEIKPKYRAVNGAVQEYLEDSSMWVNIKTYVLILYDDPNNNTVFDELSIGDCISISVDNLNIPYDLSDDDDEQTYTLKGLLEFDKELECWKNQSRIILDKGITTKHKKFDINSIYHNSNVDNRAYIVVDGYQYFKKGKNGVEYSRFNFCNYDGDDEKYRANVSISRIKPEASFACESQNRVWCCSKDGHEIYASALGNPYNYFAYNGIGTDSYAVNVGTQGEFTGCCNYLGYPLFFKENALHTIFGSLPEQYTVRTDTEFDGVEKGSERSLAVVNNILYYKAAIGIVAYDGSNTMLVSEALGKQKYINAVAGAYQNKYYVSMQNCTTGKYEMFVYDTVKGLWCKEDYAEALQFINISGELMFLTEGEIISVNNGVSDIGSDYSPEYGVDWSCETGNIGYSYPNSKYLSRFQIRMSLAHGARASFYIQYNSDGVWLRKGEMQGRGIKSYLIPIVPMRCDHMKIKIEGNGEAKIYSIAKLLEEGSDI